MKSCEAVIFDLGGVILDIDYQATERALQSLLGPAAVSYYQQNRQNSLFDDLETGHIESEVFRQQLMQWAGKPLATELIDQAWNAMLGDLPLARLDFIRQVAAKRRVFLLSNTNRIHKDAFDRIVDRALAGRSFDAYFEAAYYSHELGLRKPNPAIYRLVCDRHGLIAEKTLFIDDNASNVEGAREAGLLGFHLQGDLLQSPLSFLCE